MDLKIIKPVLRGSWTGNDNFFIDKISGKLATEFTPQETTEEKVITNVHSIIYWVDKKDISGTPPTNPNDDPQFNHWEIPIQNWWAQNSWRYKITSLNEKPDTFDDVHTESVKPTISIIEPNNRTIYTPNQRISIKVSSAGIYPIVKLDVFINDVYLGTSNSTSGFSFIPKDLEDLQKDNELRIVAHDSVYNSSEATLVFKVKQ
jgi:hypothetical protein